MMQWYWIAYLMGICSYVWILIVAWIVAMHILRLIMINAFYIV